MVQTSHHGTLGVIVTIHTQLDSRLLCCRGLLASARSRDRQVWVHLATHMITLRGPVYEGDKYPDGKDGTVWTGKWKTEGLRLAGVTLFQATINWFSLWVKLAQVWWVSQVFCPL
jgi:hypothetical protein